MTDILAGPRVVNIEYDKFAFLLTLVLSNTTKITFSPEIVPALKHASHSDLDKVGLSSLGDTIYWNSLNFSIPTEDLIKFVTNCKNTI
jgi:hypothetical protein